MSELVGVTEEIRAGFNPLAVGRKILGEQGGDAGGAGASSTSTPPGARAASGGEGAGRFVSRRATEWGPEADVRISPGFSAGKMERGAAGQALAGGRGRPAVGAAVMENTSSSAAAAHLPFSAVSVGRARKRLEVTGGADILLDGIIEAEVATKAMALMESGELDQRVAEQQDREKARGNTVVNE